MKVSGMEFEDRFLAAHGVSLFLDVGANEGQTGQALRARGYSGRIVSFEPIAACHDALARAAASDPAWDTHHGALGREDGTTEIGVSENLVSSSILPATQTLIDIHEPVRYTRREEIPLARLDTLFDRYAGAGDVVYLKVDTQGFEQEVIAGAEGVLGRIAGVRLEIAVGEVYQGEMTVPQAIELMAERGFVLIEAWPAWRHPDTDEVLQFDLMFRRRDHPAAPLKAVGRPAPQGKRGKLSRFFGSRSRG